MLPAVVNVIVLCSGETDRRQDAVCRHRIDRVIVLADILGIQHGVVIVDEGDNERLVGLEQRRKGRIGRKRTGQIAVPFAEEIVVFRSGFLRYCHAATSHRVGCGSILGNALPVKLGTIPVFEDRVHVVERGVLCRDGPVPRNILKRPTPPGEGVGPLVGCIFRTLRRVDGTIFDGVRTIFAGSDVVNAQRLVVPILEGYGVSRPRRISRGQSAVVGDVRQRRASPAEEGIGVACIIRSGRGLDLTGLNGVRHSGAVSHNAPEQDRIIPVFEGDDIADIFHVLRDEIRVPGDVFEALVPANIPKSGMTFGILVRNIDEMCRHRVLNRLAANDLCRIQRGRVRAIKEAHVVGDARSCDIDVRVPGSQFPNTVTGYIRQDDHAGYLCFFKVAAILIQTAQGVQLVIKLQHCIEAVHLPADAR